jgi:hypothetical protein
MDLSEDVDWFTVAKGSRVVRTEAGAKKSAKKRRNAHTLDGNSGTFVSVASGGPRIRVRVDGGTSHSLYAPEDWMPVTGGSK